MRLASRARLRSYPIAAAGHQAPWRNRRENYEFQTCWHLAPTFSLVGELRTREYEKETAKRRSSTVKQRVCEVALDSILKLDRAERQDERAADRACGRCRSVIPASGTARGPFRNPPRLNLDGASTDTQLVTRLRIRRDDTEPVRTSEAASILIPVCRHCLR